MIFTVLTTPKKVKATMKQLVFFLILACMGTTLRAQQPGLEAVIVETYYVSNAADAAGSVGTLPSGSTTYRIFLDMLPGYTFQAAYGEAGHELRFQTTTAFFNNEDFGSSTPSFTKTNAAQNTVMLDSWISGGQVANGQMGVLKSEDSPAGGTTVVNANGLLQNSAAAAGIPLTQQDGFYQAAIPQVTVLGFTPQQLAVIGDISNSGNLISTTNASWAVLGGSTGPTSANRVLIAQFTTNGTFSFELNVQLGTPVAGVSQKFVARNPIGNEIIFPGLIFPAPANPTAQVSISSNATFPVCQGTSVTFTATPTNGGTTPTYQWRRNNTNVGTNSPTWTTTTLNFGDVITCRMTSSISGALNNPATSNAITTNILTAPATPVVTATGPTTYCSGANACSLSTPAVSGLSYQWIRSTSTVISGATTTTYVPNLTTSNTYKVRATNSVGCSKTSATTSITVLPLPAATVTVTGPTSFCSGQNLCTLTANSGTGLSYQWFRGTTVVSGATNISVVPTVTSTQWKVRVTDANACTKLSSNTSITVFSNPTATVTPLGPTTFCNGDSVVLQASPTSGLTYQWQRNSTNITGATGGTYAAKQTGSFRVRVTNTNGCTGNSPTVSVTVNCREGNHELAGTDLSGDMNIYPNPGNGNIMITYVNESIDFANSQLMIVDMLGKVVYKEAADILDGRFSRELNLEGSLMPGIYFVKIISGEDELVRKMVVR